MSKHEAAGWWRFQESVKFQRIETVLSFFNDQAGARIEKLVQKNNETLDEMSNLLWKGYTQDYKVGFEYIPEEAPEQYRCIPYRKYNTPLFHLEDYALEDPKKMQDFKDHDQNFRSKLSSGFAFDAIVQFYVDGKRSVWEIANETMLETGDGSVEYVDHFVQLLKSYDLVGIKG